jgi:hypothetical protein
LHVDVFAKEFHHLLSIERISLRYYVEQVGMGNGRCVHALFDSEASMTLYFGHEFSRKMATRAGKEVRPFFVEDIVAFS